jgi:hypothetical protein
MPLRYYPSFKIVANQSTSGNEFTLNGKPYKGKYYRTYDNRAFTGISPETGPSQLLEKVISYQSAPGLNNANLSDRSKIDLAIRSGVSSVRVPGKPNNFYPNPTEDDYIIGYIIRYFTKKENEKGFIIEISKDEYNNITNGTADYDITLYQVTQILWKIVGPLKSVRTSQYNVTAGIIDTNQRLVETTNKTFFGLTEFIGGDYTKFARPTL